MSDISACSGVKDENYKNGFNQCKLRFQCKRYEVHLNATSKQQSYIKAAFVGQSCEFLKE